MEDHKETRPRKADRMKTEGGIKLTKKEIVLVQALERLAKKVAKGWQKIVAMEWGW